MTYTIELPDGTIVKGDDHEKVVKMAKEMRESEKVEGPTFNSPDSNANHKLPCGDGHWTYDRDTGFLEYQNNIRSTNESGL